MGAMFRDWQKEQNVTVIGRVGDISCEVRGIWSVVLCFSCWMR